MSRPKPKIIISYTDPKTYMSEQIIKADAIYSVYYKGQAINLKSVNAITNYPAAKYRKSSFSNPGHAFNLAEKLNKMFSTTDFEVYRLDGGVKINEHDK